jgi:anaerobic glycerol-3-phosphate dehydrogenase
LDEELHKKIDKLESVVDSILQVVPIISEQPKPPSLLKRIVNRLSQQGSQRGVLMLIGSVVPLLGLPTETVIQIVSAIFMIIGTQNIVTEG